MTVGNTGSGCIQPAVYVTVVTVNPAPATVVASGTGTYCGSTTITGSNGGDGTIYFQGTTSGGTSTATAATAQVVSSSGTYYFRALSTSGCWGPQGSVAVTINPLPAPIAGTTNVCVNATTSLTDATSGGVWAISNPLIATVGSGSGTVTGVSAGIATVTYTLISTGCNATATILSSPIAAPISGTTIVCTGSTTALTDNTSGGNWTSSDATIASVSLYTGIVTGVASGTVTITYGLASGCLQTTAVTVNATSAAITGVSSVCNGSTTTLTDASGTGIWTSGNLAVATIGSSSGIVTAIAPGSATISYAIASGCILTRTVSVNALPAAVTVSGSGTYCATTTITAANGGDGTIYYQGTTSGGTSTATPSTAQVITSSGTYYFRALSASGCWGAEGSTTVTINPLPGAISGTGTVCAGSSTSLSDITAGGTWSSSNANATVDGSGNVTGVYAGTAAITYTIPTGCISATIVTVNAISNISGATAVCAGAATNLSDLVTGGTWTSSNSTVAGIGSASGSVSGLTQGTSIITYTAPTGCTTTTTITVNPLPLAITGTGYVCLGSATSLTDATASGIWSSSNGAIATIGSSSGIVTAAGSGTATITYLLPTGCKITSVVTVNPLPGAIAGTANVCVGLTTSLSDASGGGTWSSSDGTLATIGSTGIVTGIAAGTPVITYTLATGCITTTIITVNPLTGITGSSPVCVGSTLNLNETTAGGAWSSSSGAIATVGSSTGIVTGVASGTATITYLLPTGCKSTSVVTVNPLPVAISGTASVCVGLPTSLSDATGSGTWSSSDGTLATIGSTGIVTGVAAGTPVITYTLGTGCLRTVTVTVNPLSAITGAGQVCIGSTVTLNDATTAGTWSSSNGTVASVGASTGIVSGVTSGTTTITYLLATGCKSTSVLTVNPLPAAITGTGNVCVGSTLTVSDATAGGSWSTSDVTLATIGSNGVVTGVGSGIVTITYTLGTGCINTAFVTVNPVPSAITGTTTVCAGSVTALNNTATGGTWSSSSTATATVDGSGNVTGVAGGTTVISYIMAAGCYATTTVTVSTILPITGTLSACIGSTTSLNDGTGGGTWSSSNPSVGSISTGGIVTGIINGSTTVSYTLSSGCIRTAVIAINSSPAAISGPSPAVVCVGATITLSDAVTGGTWHSSNASVATIGSVSGLVTGQQAGTITVVYTAGAGCTVSSVVTVNANPLPIQGATSECLGTTVSLSDGTSGGTWSSSNSNASIDGSGNITGVTVGTSTTSYTLTTGCYITYPNTVLKNPSAIFGTASVCVGATTQLSDSTAVAVNWTSSNGSIATVVNSGVVTGVSAGVATITYKIQAGSCIATQSVTVNALPAAISGNTPVCAGSTLTLTDAAGSGTWTSSNTAVATVGSGSGTVTGIVGGTAVISYTASGGCSITATVTVNPILSISGIGYVCSGSSVTLSDATSGGTWSSSNTGVATVGTSGVVTGVGAGGTVTITYKITSTGCIATSIMTVNAVSAAISGTSSVCTNYTTALTDATPGGTWSSSNGSVATVGTSGIVTANTLYVAGTTTITYAIGGCVSTKVVTVNITPLPVQGATSECMGATVSLSDANTGGTWSTSNSNASINGSGNITALAVGTSTVTYTLPTGCYITYPNTIHPNPSPIFGTATVCAGSLTELSDSTATTVSWTSSNTAVATAVNSGWITGVSAGTATITYKILIGNCITTQVVTVNPQPVAIAGNTPICQGNTITLSDATSSGTWSSTNTLVATIGSTGIVTSAAGGTSLISYTIGDGCANTTIVTVNSIAAISGNTPICTGQSITLSDAATGGSWSCSNLAVGTIDPVAGVVTPVSTGTATITYLMPTGCSATTVITVNPVISGVTITGSPVVCSGATTTLTDATAGGSWSSSDVTIGTVDPASGIVTGVAAGTVNISYSIGVGCVAANVVTIIASPASLSGTNLICAGLTTSLSDVVPDGTWSSSNAAIAYVSVYTGLVTGIAGGTASISYTTPNGCFNTVVVTVNPLVSTISGTTTICIGGNTNLTDASSGGTWSSSDNTIATVGSTGIVTGVAGGYASITYTLSTGCSNAFNVVVNPYAGIITGPVSVDVDSVITLADAIGGGIWTSSNANASVDGSGDVSGITGGTATISYSVTNVCGTAVATTILTINVGPAQVIVSGGGSYCGSTTITASNGSDGTIYYQGTNPVGTSTLTPSASQVISSSGTYYFRAQSSAGAWGVAGSAIVTINPVPAAITGSPVVCIGLSTALTDATAGGTWSSSNANATIDGSGNVTGASAGTTNITYTLPAGCTSITTATVNPLPSAITGSATVCSGLTAVLSSATSGGTWSSVSTGIGTIDPSSGTFTAIASGTTTVSYILPTGCYATTTETVNPLPANITGTATVCKGLTTSLTDATSGGTWTSSDITTATVGSTGVVTGIAANTANITYTLPTGCIATNTVTVNVLPSAITGTTNVCAGATTGLSNSTSGGTWSSGSTGVGTIDPSSGIATGISAGTTAITYTLSTGCIATANITVNALPTSVSTGGSGTFCGSTTITASNGGSGTIYFQGTTSGGTATTTPATSQVVSTSGTYYFRALSSSGCWGAQGSVSVTINPTPSAITGAATVCSGTTTALTDATSGGTWSSSNANATVDGSGNVSGITAGTATITYTLPTGCVTTFPITVYGSPSAINGSLNVCLGSTTSLSSSTAGGTWASASTGIATIGSISGTTTAVSVGSAGITYTLSTGCTATANITVNALPATVIASGGGSFCGSTTVTAANGGSGTIYFQGTTSGGTSTAIPSASQLITTSGTYYFRAQSSSGCWGTEGSVIVTINPLPAAINGPATVCLGSSITLTDATASGTWSSSNGSVASIGSASGIITTGSAGTTTIAYTLGTGCSASAVITVNSLPASVSGTTAICLGTTTVLTDATSGGTWSSSNIYVASVGSAGLVTGLVSGNANITYTDVNGCGAVSIITVNPLPSAITGTTAICMGAANSLSDATTGGTWASSTTGVATIDGSGNVTTVSAGTSNITYTLPTGCIATTTITVNPISAILNASGVCLGNTITLSDATSGGSWSSSNTSIAGIGTSGILTGLSTGTTTITYTMPSGCTATTTITVNPAPSAITGNTIVCVGFTSALTDAGGGTWTSSNTSIATVGSASAVVTGVGAGTAGITYSLATGCTATVIVTVTSVPGSINGATSVCAGSAITLTDAVSGGSWSSSNTANASVGSLTGIVTGVGGGVATITYTMAAGCYVTSGITVNAIQPILGTLSACIGSTTRLSDGSSGGTWSSSNPSIGSVGSSTGIVAGISSGSVTISYTIPSGCVRTVSVQINGLPSAISGPSPTAVCIGGTITLSDATTGGTWNSSNTSVATIGSSSGVVSGLQAGTITVVYTAGAGCTVSNVVTVNPNPLPIQGSASECLGTTVSLSDANSGGTWSSSNSNASIDGSGNITGLIVGTSTTTYTLPTGCYITYPNTVNKNPSAIFGTFSVCVGSATQLSDSTATSVSWTSSNTLVASVVNSGTVTGIGAGTAIITYKILTGSCITTQTVTVNALPAAITGNTPVCAGSTITLTDVAGAGTWTSSNAAIASVGTGLGVVTGVAGGTAVISYKPSGGCTVNTTVTVNPIFAISGGTNACVGSTTSLSDATTGGTWASSNTSIATVASTGIVTGVSAGSATITYTLATGCTRTTSVNIGSIAPITGTLSVCTNYTTALTDVTSGGTWSSTNASIASVNASGLVTANTLYNAGTATISYAIGTCAATKVVTVNSTPQPIHGATSECMGTTVSLSDAIAGGTWSSSNANASIDGSGNITGVAVGTSTTSYTVSTGCYITYPNTVLADPTPILGTFTVCTGSFTLLTDATSNATSWTSSNTLVATAANSGAVTGVAAGTAIITYTIHSGCSITQTVTVNPTPGAGTISGTMTVAVGANVTLTDAVTGGTWTSSNIPVAVIGSASGTVTGNNPGNATISYHVTNTYGCGAYATSLFTVTATAPHSIAANDVTICIGSSTTLNDVASGGTWSSGNDNIAIVDANGMVTGLSAGNAAISYTLVSGFGTSITTIPVVVVPLPGAVTIAANPGTVISKGESLILSATAENAGPAPVFQWLINNVPVSGATSSVFVNNSLSDNDSVTCNVISSGACSGYTVSATVGISVGSLGVHSNLATVSDVRILPNPNKGAFTLKGTLGITTDEEVTVEVTDILGQVVYRNKATAQNGVVNENISLSSMLANGMYILNLRSDTINKVFHFVIEK